MADIASTIDAIAPKNSIASIVDAILRISELSEHYFPILEILGL